jgi:UDP-N-acetylmuramyl pentapeptide phosphotransferase/UDP-N-acetylglucosamine-1-phosphate transferase
MQVVRTIALILLTAVVVAFVVANWSEPQNVKLWPVSAEAGGWYVMMWPVGFIALVFSLIGFVPMWVYHRAAKWQLHRRIAALEAAARSAAIAAAQVAPTAEPVVETAEAALGPATEPTPAPAPVAQSGTPHP